MAVVKIKNLLTKEQLEQISKIVKKKVRRDGHNEMMKSQKHTVKKNKKKYNRKNKNSIKWKD
jgi:hypothetical protein